MTPPEIETGPPLLEDIINLIHFCHLVITKLYRCVQGVCIFENGSNKSKFDPGGNKEEIEQVTLFTI
jgi:hypothetical protein